MCMCYVLSVPNVSLRVLLTLLRFPSRCPWSSRSLSLLITSLPACCADVCLCRWVCVHVLRFVSAHSQLHSQAHSQLHSQAHSQLHSRAHSQLHNQAHSQLHSQAHSQLHSQAQCEMCHCVYFLPCCVSLTPNLLWFPGQVDVSCKSFLFVIIVQLGSLAKKRKTENLTLLCKSGWLPHGCHAGDWQDSHDATCPNDSHF